MTIIELKEAIIKNKLPDDLIVMVSKNNKFLADQYLNAIIEKNIERVHYINNLQETFNTALALVSETSNNLNILRIENFEESLYDYSIIKNTIVVCEIVDKSIKSIVAPYVIELPAFEKWQVDAYMSTLCPGLDKSDRDWLYSNTAGDIFKLTNELDKIKLFPKEQQTEILSELHFEPNTDLFYISDKWAFVNCIVANNSALVFEFLRHRKYVDCSGNYMIAGLLGGFKGNKDHFSEETYIKIIEFLSGIDQRIVNGKLSLSDEDPRFLDYVICKLFEFMGN